MMRRPLHIPLLVILIYLTVPTYPARAQGNVAVQIRAAAERVLAERYPQDAYRLAVEVVRTGGLDDAGTDLRLAFPEADALPRAYTQVDVLAPGTASGWEKTGWALLHIAHYDSIAVLQTTLQKDEAVPEASVQAAWLETTAHGDGLVRMADYRAQAASEPLYARRTLRAGRALRPADLRPSYAAQLGEAVVLTYQRGNIHLKLTCKARAPGFVGDVIRLYAPQTGNSYRARLTAPGAAAWLETL